MKPSPLMRYGIAVLAVAVALQAKLLLEPVIVQEAPFLLVFGAVIIAAWYGGLGPGLLSIALAAFATDYFFLYPITALSSPGSEAVPLGVFVVEALLVSGIVVALRSARLRAEASAQEAQGHQESLRSSEERFRLLVEGVQDYAIFMLGPAGDVVSWNAGAERITGYGAEEITGEHFSRFFTEEDVERGHPEEELRAAVAEGCHEEEGWRVREDGSRFWASVVITPLRDEDGELRGFSNVMRDVSERRRAEEALKESEERHRAVVEQVAEGIFLSDADTLRVLDSNAATRELLGYTAEELRGMTVYDIVADERAGVNLHAQRIREKKSHSIGNRRYRRKDGSLVDVEVNTSMISYGGREVICVVAHDITERKLAEQRLHRSVNALLALYEAGQILSSTLEREEIGSRLLRIMQRVSGLVAAVINLRDEQGRLCVLCTTASEDDWHWARHTPEARAARDEVLETENLRSFRLRRGPEEAPLAGLCVPLRVRDELIGVVEAYGPEALEDEGTVETLASLSSQAASALENGRLYEELAERGRQLKSLVGRLMAAQEEERRRVAYEIHDGMTQVAIASYQHLQAFAEEFPPDSVEGREQLDWSLELAQQAVREARQVIAGLRPTTLDDFGLASAIRLQVEALLSEGWQVDYEETLGDERLPVAVETALYRVAQEALTNVRKHAQTTRVGVKLQRLDGNVSLQVQDRGRGFDPSAAGNGGGPGERVGLSSMHERVALLGGDLEIHSKPGEGTSVVVDVPLSREDANHGE